MDNAFYPWSTIDAIHGQLQKTQNYYLKTEKIKMV